ncbi:hypothetical protein BCR42DRAFT_108636 [Absidia repens]|uniref:Uncharacterized protein n=1 Tax=Absidia repens TaxID=90262 RepID=A0A1X2I6D6_9FUNG|nr:hypothetical protein BCR42DRAFT_108636 [Absidia repens]
MMISIGADNDMGADVNRIFNLFYFMPSTFSFFALPPLLHSHSSYIISNTFVYLSHSPFFVCFNYPSGLHLISPINVSFCFGVFILQYTSRLSR